jgi:zinc transporter
VTAIETYGSDQHGLVFAYLFRRGEPACPITGEAALDWLRQRLGEQDDRFLWLHFSTANAASERWMTEHLALPDEFLDSLHQPASSTRIEQSGDALMAVIHDVTYDSSFEESAVSSVSLCVDRHLAVSARRAPLRAVERLRLSVKAGEVFGSPVELFAHLLRDQADVLVEVVRHATMRVNTIEDRLLAGRVMASREELGAVRRMLVRLQRLLAPEPAALFRLLSKPPSWIGDADVQELRASAEVLSAAAADAAALAERVKLLQEELTAHLSEQTSRILFLLTVATVLALPFNVVGALFGMNVGGIPWANHPAGFWALVVIVTVFTAIFGAIVWRGRPR